MRLAREKQAVTVSSQVGAAVTVRLATMSICRLGALSQRVDLKCYQSACPGCDSMSHDDLIAANALFWATICGLLAFVAPWVALFFRRWAAAAVAGLLTLIRDYHGVHLQ